MAIFILAIVVILLTVSSAMNTFTAFTTPTAYTVSKFHSKTQSATNKPTQTHQFFPKQKRHQSATPIFANHPANESPPTTTTIRKRDRILSTLSRLKLSKLSATVERESDTETTPNSLANSISEAASIGGFVEDDDGCTISPTTSKVVCTPKPPSPSYNTFLDSLTISEKDSLSGDFSAAFAPPSTPALPFILPTLTSNQTQRLLAGQRLQEQSKMGSSGKGFVCFDVHASSEDVWDTLLNFEGYVNTIPTVREMNMYTNTHLDRSYLSEKKLKKEDVLGGKIAFLKHGVPSVTRARFVLSKFRLKIAAIHNYRPHPLGDYMVFTLDPACTNMVLKEAKGIWHTESNVDGRGEGWTRVWLLCEIKISKALPQFVVDYAAKKAMPRATTWLKPTVELRRGRFRERDEE